LIINHYKNAFCVFISSVFWAFLRLSECLAAKNGFLGGHFCHFAISDILIFDFEGVDGLVGGHTRDWAGKGAGNCGKSCIFADLFCIIKW
jgi:hypothetical protein